MTAMTAEVPTRSCGDKCDLVFSAQHGSRAGTEEAEALLRLHDELLSVQDLDPVASAQLVAIVLGQEEYDITGPVSPL